MRVAGIDNRARLTRHQLNYGLVSWLAPYRASLAGAVVMKDLSGKWDGTLTNMEAMGDYSADAPPGLPFGSLSLDGVDEGVSLPATTESPAAQTTACWFKLSSLVPAYTALYYRALGIAVYVKSTGKLAYFSNASGGVWAIDGSGALTISANTWNWVCFAYDAAIGDCYVNGTLDVTAVGSGTNVSALGSSPCWGIDYGTPGRYPTGKITDLRVWNRRLNRQEIIAAYKDSLSGCPLTLRYNPLQRGMLPEVEF